MDANRIDTIARFLTTLGSRRGALRGLVAGISTLIPRLGTDARRGKNRKKEPKPAPPKCSKLYGKCFVNSDCCARGARCDRTGRNRCLCKRGRAICKPQGTCCPNGQVCCGRCANLKTSPDHCGACGAACAVGEVCIGGICTA
jgi:hypothetical protein